MSEHSMPLVAHLIELRDRVVKSLILLTVIFAGLFYFSNSFFEWLSAPLQQYLPDDGEAMIATGITSPFFVPIKLTLVMSVFIAIPFMLYQLWSFIAPALYKHEKKIAIPLFISSVILFYAGVAFAYFVVFPLVFGFLTGVGPTGVKVMPDIANALSFMLKMFFAFGFAFEIPIATVILVWAGITDVESLKAKRPHIFVGCFVVGMILTPPDMISQTILAIPMWLLFEGGLFFCKFIPKGDREDYDEEEK